MRWSFAGSLLTVLLTSGLAAGSPQVWAAGKTHLFILSGQSNMVRLDPSSSFTPALQKALPGDEMIVVKDALGAQPIRRWFKEWKPASGDVTTGNGDLYDRLMNQVKQRLGGRQPDTITFVWMQGERDARLQQGDVYAVSLRGLIDQLKTDLGRRDVNFVIGRLSDHFVGNRHWDLVRKAQMAVSEGDPRGVWIDTDDLNGRRNRLHYNSSGYHVMGERFAEKAVELITAP